ncbi:hypothetical protein ATV_gp03 [Bicaudavirus pozzuoliense]|uniref:Uncharacterized protein ORF79 n=2 Tax=Acidianus two-tailed virus TaxID=315953 RepID=Y079_ATV|nr:hypothetical protein ATV_gp03 [Acidianus two-tailed virus]Q3V4T5.1 RecName: Full=Uncharacterized protein ORF79 [Acidianus two-tailed virus]AON96483.1 hypothetical protein [Acidianus two-tailed phage variant 1]CAI59879.1 hypothetical protein [Acidianus two-tailed virus]
MVEVLRFKDEKEYREWLSWQSGSVKDKASEYERRYPGTVPIVIELDVDTCPYCGGGEGTHIFIPPHLENIISQIVFDSQ